jgi:ABC-type sugar transport system substrate-binding protein
MTDQSIVVGYAHQTAELAFIMAVYDSFKQAVANQSADITILERDNKMDNDVAIANMEYFAEQNVDVVITCHVDERSGTSVIKPLTRKGIPIISLEIPILFTKFISIDNQLAARLLGTAIGEWIQQYWDGQVDKVLMMDDYRLTGVIRERFNVTISSLLEKLGKTDDIVMRVHSGNIRSTAYENAYPILERWASEEGKIAIIGGNDETGMGAYDAALELGIQDRIVACGHGATVSLEEFEKPDSRFVATTAFYPHKYGQPMLDLVLNLVSGTPATNKTLITPELVVHPKYTSITE